MQIISDTMSRLSRILKVTRSYRGLFNERLTDFLYRCLARKKYEGITWLEQEGILIHFQSDDYIGRKVWMQGVYESEIRDVMAGLVKEDAVVLDIGANIGIQSLRLSRMVGSKGKVYAFEPIPYTRGLLEKNISLNAAANITVFPYALGDINETVTIRFSEQTDNLGAVTLRNGDGKGNLQVDVRRGDELIAEHHIERISFIKIDVEGFEWKVLKGLSGTIRAQRPMIILEWDTNYQGESGVTPADWNSFLSEYNYKLYQVHDSFLEPVERFEEASLSNLLLLPRP